MPAGSIALFSPAMGKWFVDTLIWRHIYWTGVPLLILCLLMAPIIVPSMTKKIVRKIDVRGAILVAIASATTILGPSFAGTYPWASVQVLSQLGAALVFWMLFFGAEGAADEPIRDPQVFCNRTFLTVAISGLLSFFGLRAIVMHYAIFLRGGGSRNRRYAKRSVSHPL
jgi:hypothetical protein